VVTAAAVVAAAVVVILVAVGILVAAGILVAVGAATWAADTDMDMALGSVWVWGPFIMAIHIGVATHLTIITTRMAAMIPIMLQMLAIPHHRRRRALTCPTRAKFRRRLVPQHLIGITATIRRVTILT
jgi:hypothetical protein